MKIFYAIYILIFFGSCQQNKSEITSNPSDTVHVATKIPPSNEIATTNSAIEDMQDWQVGFGLTHNPTIDSIWFNPISYYLNDTNCADLAEQFYYGKLRPQDNEETDELLGLVMSKNDKMRPLYRWCLDKTILIQDGALGEHTGQPARRYAESFPAEFLVYMNMDNTGEKYKRWVEAIAYSGFYATDDVENTDQIKENLIKTMKINCTNCSPKILQQIEKFGQDCFKSGSQMR